MWLCESFLFYSLGVELMKDFSGYHKEIIKKKTQSFASLARFISTPLPSQRKSIVDEEMHGNSEGFPWSSELPQAISFLVTLHSTAGISASLAN
jgi:hypothetical protein